MTDTALNGALETLVAARKEIRELPAQAAKTALTQLHEAVWYIDEDLRTRDKIPPS
jgi:hypothetical protein